MNPEFDIDRAQVVDLLLASIGLEELSLAHLVNAEAEKVQRALGTLQIPGTTGDTENDYYASLITDFNDLLSINRSVNKTLKFSMHKEFLLLTKLEDIIDFDLETNGMNDRCCTNTIGYWRREENILSSYLPIYLGTPGGAFTELVETAERAAEIAATTGGLYNQLKAQLISTKLNFFRCQIDFEQLPQMVRNAINSADAFLAANDMVAPGQVPTVSSLVDTLTAFNEGAFTGFPHCN